MGKMHNWIEGVIAVSTGLMVWLVEQTPDEITLLSLIYVTLASGAGLGFFRLVVKFYKWWVESTEERNQRLRKNSRQDLDRIIEILHDQAEQKDLIIHELRKEIEELKG